MKPNLAKVLSQSYKKLKAVFGHKTKQFIDIVVTLIGLLCQPTTRLLRGPGSSREGWWQQANSEAFRGSMQGSKDLGSRSYSERQRHAK